MKAPSCGHHLLVVMKPWAASSRLSSPPLKRNNTGEASRVSGLASRARATSSMTPTQEAQSLAPAGEDPCESLEGFKGPGWWTGQASAHPLCQKISQTDVELARHPGGFASAVRQCKRKVRQGYAASCVDTKAYVEAD